MKKSTRGRRPVHTFRDLETWQVAMDLAVEVYKTTARLPRDERFGLVSQMRRAAVSVPSNIAEGFTRDSLDDYRRFLAMSRGSVAELDTQLELCERLEFLTAEAAAPMRKTADRVSGMIYSLRRSLLRSRD